MAVKKMAYNPKTLAKSGFAIEITTGINFWLLLP